MFIGFFVVLFYEKKVVLWFNSERYNSSLMLRFEPHLVFHKTWCNLEKSEKVCCLVSHQLCGWKNYIFQFVPRALKQSSTLKLLKKRRKWINWRDSTLVINRFVVSIMTFPLYSTATIMCMNKSDLALSSNFESSLDCLKQGWPIYWWNVYVLYRWKG